MTHPERPLCTFSTAMKVAAISVIATFVFFLATGATLADIVELKNDNDDVWGSSRTGRVKGDIDAAVFSPSVELFPVTVNSVQFMLHRPQEEPAPWIGDSARMRVQLYEMQGGIAREWNADDGELTHTFSGYEGGVSAVAYAPDGTQVVTGGWDHVARLWDAESGELQHHLVGHTDSILSVAFSPDGDRVLTGSWDGTARVWRVSDGQLLRTFLSDGGGVTSVAFSPDGSQVLAGTWNGLPRLWDANDGHLIRTFVSSAGGTTSVDFSPDGAQVLTAGRDGIVRLWDATDGRMLRTFAAGAGDITSVVFSPSGAQVLAGSWDGAARLWDTADGQLRRTFEGNANTTTNINRITSVAFSPNGEQILTGGRDGKARLWNRANGQLVRVLDGRFASVTSVAFSSDGTRVLAGSNATPARLLAESAPQSYTALDQWLSIDLDDPVTIDEPASFMATVKWESGNFSESDLPLALDSNLNAPQIIKDQKNLYHGGYRPEACRTDFCAHSELGLEYQGQSVGFNMIRVRIDTPADPTETPAVETATPTSTPNATATPTPEPSPEKGQLYLPLVSRNAGMFLQTLQLGSETGEAVSFALTSGEAVADQCWPGGDENNLWVGREPADERGIMRSVIRFDLSTIPPDAVVSEAQLQLVVVESETDGGRSMPVSVHSITRSWAGCPSWNTLGAAAGESWASVRVGARVETIQIDVTALVQAWLRGDASKNGLMLRGDEETTGRLRGFVPSTSSQEDLRPKLLIRYTTP